VSGVAAVALGLRVPSRQRVLRVAVVAEDDVAPALVGVAAGALVAVPVLVRVVLPVAADAGLRGALVALRIAVAVLAFDIAMSAAQLEH
jgi:hypothetical protein